jgi:hypothetical protein
MKYYKTQTGRQKFQFSVDCRWHPSEIQSLEVDRRFRGAYCLRHLGDESLPSSYSPPWEPEISQRGLVQQLEYKDVIHDFASLKAKTAQKCRPSSDVDEWENFGPPLHSSCPTMFCFSVRVLGAVLKADTISQPVERALSGSAAFNCSGYY